MTQIGTSFENFALNTAPAANKNNVSAPFTSAANNNILERTPSSDTFESKDNNSKKKKALLALAAIATAAVGIYCYVNHKRKPDTSKAITGTISNIRNGNASEVMQNGAETVQNAGRKIDTQKAANATKKAADGTNASSAPRSMQEMLDELHILTGNSTQNLEDITFKDGKAYFKDDIFHGKVHCNLKNGDTAILEYDSLGKLVKSEVSGSRNVVKNYDNISGTVEIIENSTTRKVAPAAMRREALEKISAQKANDERFNFIMGKTKYHEVSSILNNERQKSGLARLSDEQLSQVEKLKNELYEKYRYSNVLQHIEENKSVSVRADKLMEDSEFCKKLDEFMNTKYSLPKSKYDCTVVETTIDDVLKGTIKGTADNVPDVIYHGTSKYSYNDILKNGFSLDAANITESGKGIYFGVDKAGAERYCADGGRIVKAKYTGRKIAKVKPGVVNDLASYTVLKNDAAAKLGLNIMEDESDARLLNELINRRYAKQLFDMGYDAVTTASIGAGCEYINVLNPKNIQILG